MQSIRQLHPDPTVNRSARSPATRKRGEKASSPDALPVRVTASRSGHGEKNGSPQPPLIRPVESELAATSRPVGRELPLHQVNVEVRLRFNRLGTSERPQDAPLSVLRIR